MTTVADASGLAHFIDKTTMHLERQSASGDPICGPGQFVGADFSPGEKRFYRTVELGPD